MPDLPVDRRAGDRAGPPDGRASPTTAASPWSSLDDDGVLCSLTSLDEPGLRFLVVPPASFFPDYAPEVHDDVVADLAIETADDVLLLVVLNAGDSLESTTANLAAPVLVNPPPGAAARSCSTSPGLPVAAPLLGAATDDGVDR